MCSTTRASTEVEEEVEPVPSSSVYVPQNASRNARTSEGGRLELIVAAALRISVGVCAFAQTRVSTRARHGSGYACLSKRRQRMHVRGGATERGFCGGSHLRGAKVREELAVVEEA